MYKAGDAKPKEGTVVMLKNGAKAKVVNGKFKFVKGGDKTKLKAHLNKVWFQRTIF